MEHSDVSEIFEVPDTPDRIPAQNVNARNRIKRGSYASVTNYSRPKELSEECIINKPTENGSQRLLTRTSESPSISENSDCHVSSFSTRNLCSPKNALPLKRIEKGKDICTSNSNSSRADEIPKLSVPTNLSFSSHGQINSSSALTSDRGKGIVLVVNSSPKVGKIRQKRLVRNGCISPLNIAKGIQSNEKTNGGSVRLGHGDSRTLTSHGVTQLGGIDIRGLVNEPSDSHRVGGKSVVSHRLPSKGPDANSSRSSKTSQNNNTDGTCNSNGDGCQSISEGLGGWRSTRNRTKTTNPPPVQKLPPTNARYKRQKQGPTSITNGECSTSNFDDSELVCLGSSMEPSNFRSSGAWTQNGPGNLVPFIEIGESSPQAGNTNEDSQIRARQLEADEMLARELQEELYNEAPVFGAPVGEIDADIALTLQQQESSLHALPSRNRAASRPRNSINSNLRRQSQSLSSRNPTSRRTSVQAPTAARMAQLRARFLEQHRTLSSSSSTGGNSLFPPDMDVDYRMYILEALGAFSDIGMPGGALQVQRDFNENDYEMLLALDENNHLHGGASVAQINGLPQSTLQSDNSEEACAICLDTPSIGDTIRHLPCFHKFHKDCIDPWLRRKTSCPGLLKGSGQIVQNSNHSVLTLYSVPTLHG